MKTKLAALLLASACLAAPVQAASGHVPRCDPGDGRAVHPHGTRRAIGGHPVPMSANLVRNLVREGALGGETKIRPTGTPARAGGPAPGKGLHQLGDATCPRTPAQLAGRLRSALGDGQVNRLASLYDWNGQSSREARPILQKLERLSERPLIDGQYFGESSGGTVQLVQGSQGAATVTEIAVNRRAGCLLLAL